MSADRELFALVVRDGQVGIRCSTCRLVSFNPSDVEHKYCGYCHVFLLDVAGVPA